MQSYIRPLGEDMTCLRALMKSALPRLINSAASQALGLSRVWGSRSDLSYHQCDHNLASYGRTLESLGDVKILMKVLNDTYWYFIV